MLKNLTYSGIYIDYNISVHITLENPALYGFEPSSLLFNLSFKSKNDTNTPKLKDFTFYIMDEANRLYNTYTTTVPDIDIPNSEPGCKPDGQIHAAFHPHFLFQDLRIALYYQPYRTIHIFDLSH